LGVLQEQQCAWLHGQQNLCALLGVWAATHLAALNTTKNTPVATLLQELLTAVLPQQAAFPKGGAALLRALPGAAQAAPAQLGALWAHYHTETQALQPPELASHALCAAKTPKMFVAACVPPHVETALVHTLKACPGEPGPAMDSTLAELQNAFRCSCWNDTHSDGEAFVSHLLRYLLVALHPSAEQIRSPSINRWSLAAWFLTGGVQGGGASMPSDTLLDALFWDVWVFRSKRNIMLIEPAVLLLASCGASVVAAPDTSPAWVTPALAQHVARYMLRCMTTDRLQARHGISPQAACSGATAALQAALHLRVLRSVSQLSAATAGDAELYKGLQQCLPSVLPAAPQGAVAGGAAAAGPPPAAAGSHSPSAQKRHRDGTPVSDAGSVADDDGDVVLLGGAQAAAREHATTPLAQRNRGGQNHEWAMSTVTALLKACQQYSTGVLSSAGATGPGARRTSFSPEVALSVLAPFLESHLGDAVGGRPADSLQSLQLTAAELACAVAPWLWDPKTWEEADPGEAASLLQVHSKACSAAAAQGDKQTAQSAVSAVLFLVEVFLFAAARAGPGSSEYPLTSIAPGTVSLSSQQHCKNTFVLLGVFLGCLDTECTLDRALDLRGGAGGRTAGTTGIVSLLLLQACACGERVGFAGQALPFMDGARSVAVALQTAAAAAACVDALGALLDEGGSGGGTSTQQWFCLSLVPTLVSHATSADTHVAQCVAGRTWWCTALVRSIGPGLPLPSQPTITCALPGSAAPLALSAVLLSVLPWPSEGREQWLQPTAKAATAAAEALLGIPAAIGPAAHGSAAAHAAVQLGVLLLRGVLQADASAQKAAMGGLRGAAAAKGGGVAQAAQLLHSLGAL